MNMNVPHFCLMIFLLPIIYQSFKEMGFCQIWMCQLKLLHNLYIVQCKILSVVHTNVIFKLKSGLTKREAY